MLAQLKYFWDMAYNNRNRIKQIREILRVYYSEKQEHIPDTRMVKQIFPKHGIHISYRSWMNIKGMNVNELKAV